MNNDKLSMMIEFTNLNGDIRRNKLKMQLIDGGLQIFINNGVTKEGINKYAGIRLPKRDVQKVIEYLKKQVDMIQ